MSHPSPLVQHPDHTELLRQARPHPGIYLGLDRRAVFNERDYPRAPIRSGAQNDVLKRSYRFTDLVVPRRSLKPSAAVRTSEETVALVRRLAALYPDAVIAGSSTAKAAARHGDCASPSPASPICAGRGRSRATDRLSTLPRVRSLICGRRPSSWEWPRRRSTAGSTVARLRYCRSTTPWWSKLGSCGPALASAGVWVCPAPIRPGRRPPSQPKRHSGSEERKRRLLLEFGR